MATPMQRLAEAFRRREPRRKVEMYLVHRPARAAVPSDAIAPGVRALAWRDFVAEALQ
jgi:hypothetical protein